MSDQTQNARSPRSTNEPITAYLDENVAWEIVPAPTINDENLPYPTHSGTLNIFGIEVKCHRLNTGEAIIEADSMRQILELMQ